MAHDFTKFPELTRNQMETLYFESPHKQIQEDFTAKVIKVIDGDTISLRWKERDFDFDLRFANINAPEMNEGSAGRDSKKWLEEQILNEEVDTIIDPLNTVEKFGRLLGEVVFGGRNMGEASLAAKQSRIFGDDTDGRIPGVEEIFK